MQKQNNLDISIKIGGEAGFGIMVTGQIFSKALLRYGYNIFDFIEYPSLIRGGHNVYNLRVSTKKIYSHKDYINILVALNQESINLHLSHLLPGGILIYDGESNNRMTEFFHRKDINLISIPLLKMAREKGGNELTKNSVALGATSAIIGLDFEILSNSISDAFATKSKKVVDMNVKAARGGYNYFKENYKDAFFQIKKIDRDKHMVLTGNEAICLGAIQAGCKFYVAYPMTPASSILHFMAANEERFQIAVKHAEDEIAVINMAIGASLVGVRAMLATSGGGFSLMTEGLGLAGISETPLVAIEAQRPGPATGMPTWTEQGDLKFLINAAQGEFFRFIIAPGDVKECFYLTAEAFNLAERFQTPVIIVTDKHLAESHWSSKKFDLLKIKIDRGKRLSDEELQKIQNYYRYAPSKDGISPRAVPGQPNGMHIANSYEHDKYGYSSEDAEERVRQVSKRLRKEKVAGKEVPEPAIYGPEEADISIIGWGSTKGAILDSLQLLSDEGVKANYLQVTFIRPFPSEPVSRFINKSLKTICVENNGTGQLAQVIREKTGQALEFNYLKNDGRPFSGDDIFSEIMEVI